MDSSILHCPAEVLHSILSYLGPFDLEQVSKTLNTTLFNAAYPLFLQHKPWVQNAREMCTRFKPRRPGKFIPSYPGRLPVLEEQWSTYTAGLPGGPGQYTVDSLGLRSGSEHVATSPPDLRSWLKLDGSFDWLEPLDGKMKVEWEVYSGPSGEKAPGTPEEIKDVVESAEKLGLVLPAGFEAFMSSKELHYRIPSSLAWYFLLSPITKAPKELDGGAESYVIQFHVDQQCCAYAYLYLDTSGHQCVLVSMDDWCDPSNEDPSSPDESQQKEEGEESQRQVADDSGNDNINFTLHSLSFEEYLATVYYEQLLYFGADPFQGLKNYVSHVYRAKE